MTNFVVEVRFVIVTPLHPHFFEERYALAYKTILRSYRESESHIKYIFIPKPISEK